MRGHRKNAITAIASGPAGSSGTFRNLIVQDNESINSGVSGGAGMYISGGQSNPTIDRCIFRRNTLVNSSFGGAGLCVDFAQANVSRCEFSDNLESGAAGGGLSVDSGTVRLRHCKFIDNTTVNSVGGGGASLSFMPHDTPIVDCLFEGNRAICDDCIGAAPVGGEGAGARRR
ncbi:MAG: hypothetical protein IPK83_00085 [Planctomycetes bacterium]|nr:hypothetical protein [Planctomycetota bacterium]